MMVSKIAVIALVAIVACPILLGYALNLEETQQVRYVEGEDSINLTGLLSTSTASEYSPANIYELNSRILRYTGSGGAVDSATADFKVYPRYISYVTTATSIPMEATQYAAGVKPGNITLADYYYYQMRVSGEAYNSGVNQLLVNVYNSSNALIGIIPHVYLIEYNDETLTIYIAPNNANEGGTVYSYTTAASITYSNDSYTGSAIVYAQPKGRDPYTYADMAAGWKADAKIANFWQPKSPASTILYTIDLKTMDAVRALPTGVYQYTLYIRSDTDSTLPFIGAIPFVYDTASDSWYLGNPADGRVLIYDNSKSSETYQILIGKSGYELRYVGNWPTMVGESNYYRKWFSAWTTPLTAQESISGIMLGSDIPQNSPAYYPTMRVDYAALKSMNYKVIANTTFNPDDYATNGDFQTNISDIKVIGMGSLQFGGQTFQIKNNKIEINSHEVDIGTIDFKSIRNGNVYDNMMNNSIISTTAQPSTITLNGAWVATVTVTNLEVETYTSTEWIPGHFGWNGIDDNFLMVGLITCLGVFIALGIYARKRGTGGIIPLMIVVGGAAMVFFIML